MPTIAASPQPVLLRQATLDDVRQLYAIEVACFETDRLKLRRLRHWIKADNRVMTVAVMGEEVLGYGLALLHRGTRLARLYSIAVLPSARGLGISKLILQRLENEAADQGRLFMRLEVAKDNAAAVGLYKSQGYRVYGTYKEYYEDLSDALRMQKRIRYRPQNALNLSVPWYQQSTDFTCGPAALMMAMASLAPNNRNLTLEEELDIWREATTVFMTSGHGGCHPVGLGLAAKRRGFDATVCLNKSTTLFIDGVRSAKKKEVMTTVDRQFRRQAEDLGITVRQCEVSQSLIAESLRQGAAVIVLISTYHLDGKKAPHWVTVTGMDDVCFYVHDPDLYKDEQSSLDCQHLPIARADFERMSAFGSERLRTAVIISNPDKSFALS